MPALSIKRTRRGMAAAIVCLMKQLLAVVPADSCSSSMKAAESSVVLPLPSSSTSRRTAPAAKATCWAALLLAVKMHSATLAPVVSLGLLLSSS